MLFFDQEKLAVLVKEMALRLSTFWNTLFIAKVHFEIFFCWYVQFESDKYNFAVDLSIYFMFDRIVSTSSLNSPWPLGILSTYSESKEFFNSLKIAYHVKHILIKTILLFS